MRSGEYLDAIMRSARRLPCSLSPISAPPFVLAHLPLPPDAVLFCVDENHVITFFSGTSHSLRPPTAEEGDYEHERRDDEMIGLPIQTVCANQHLAEGCRRVLTEGLVSSTAALRVLM